MPRIDDTAFEPLEDHLDFCVDNLRHPECTLAEAGRFYEEAAERLRAHAILRLLIDADAPGFSNDLVMSGQARRGYLRRCARKQYGDYFGALSRSGSFVDAVAGGDFALAREVFALSPTQWRQGDEYEDDFLYSRFLGLLLADAPGAGLDAVLAQLARAAADGDTSRLQVCRALRARAGFEEAFAGLLQRREAEISEDSELATEELHVALDAQIFVEGVAVLRLARMAGLPVLREYPMCPALALGEGAPARPLDEFATP